MSQPERVIVNAPPVKRDEQKDWTCFANMYPLHGEPFSRYFPDLATYRRLSKDFTGTYIAVEVATLNTETQQWIASQPDVFYGGSLFSGARRFSPPQKR